MDWPYKAALTAAVVAAVMMAARLFGRQAAGLLAGLPVISAPALMWLAKEQGADFAAASAVGSLAACVGAAAFAWSFESLARRRGAGLALAGAVAAFALSAAATRPLEGHPAVALLGAAVTCWIVQRALSARTVHSGWVRPLRGEPWLSALFAGAVSAAVSLIAQRVGPYWSGLLSALPIISACAMVHLRLAGGPGDVTRFVTGYVPGLFAKVLFLVAFTLLAPRLGAVAALWLALGVGAAGAYARGWAQVPRGGARAAIRSLRG